MDSYAATRRRRQASRISASLGGYALVGGLATLLGWIFNIPRLTDWDGNGISQMPNNALGVLACAAALMLVSLGRCRTAGVLGAFASLIGAATLSQYFSGVDLGIDRLLAHREWGQRGTVAPGRMGPPGATSLAIVGLSILLLSFKKTRSFATLGGLLTIAIAMFSILGYTFGADRLYTLPKLTTIAFQTSTMLFALGIGLVTAVPDGQPMKLILGNSSATLLVRRALPGVFLIPIVLGLLSLRGQQAGWFDAAFGDAILVLTLIALLTTLLWWSANAVRRHELAVRASQEQLAGILESITDAVITLGPDWRINFVNDAMEARTKQRRTELIGQSIWDIFPDANGNQAHRQLQRAMADRVTVEYEVFHSPWQLWFADRAYPTADGGLAVYSRDITERKRADERLHASEERMQLAMNIADAATWDLDLITGVNHWSDSHFTLLGYQPTPNRHAESAMWRTAIVAEDQPKVLAEWQRAERERDTFRSEHRLRRADDGRIIWANSAGQFFYDSTGKAVRFVGVFYDITARKRSEEQLGRLAAELREADRRKDEFLATLAHELRNPLAPIRNSLQVLKLAPNDAPLLEKVCGTMERQLNQMVRLIDDLMDVSRVTRGKLELRKERVELATVLNHVVEACAPLVQAANHDLTVALPSTPIVLDADPVRLAQVFGNLLTNACKYMEPGGRIWLAAERRGREVVASIKDSGLGIAPEMLPKVFEMFTQVDRTLERSQGGLGIGLTLVKQLTELHGGTVAADSSGLGRGSEFIVRLPVAIEVAEPETNAPPAAESNSIVRRRVLVVDDNRDSALSLSMLLEMFGHEVQTGHDGVEAVEKAGAFQPDLILLDIGLPKLNGYDACRTIREQPWGRDIQLVALTGWGQEDDRCKSRDAGFDAHLVKPLDHAELLKLLANDARPGWRRLATSGTA